MLQEGGDDAKGAQRRNVGEPERYTREVRRHARERHERGPDEAGNAVVQDRVRDQEAERPSHERAQSRQLEGELEGLRVGRAEDVRDIGEREGPVRGPEGANDELAGRYQQEDADVGEEGEHPDQGPPPGT